MEYKGIVQKSKTVDMTLIVGALGLLETKFSMLQGILGEWYGLSYVILAVVFYILRRMTSSSLGDK